jgi:hypothetical protein
VDTALESMNANTQTALMDLSGSTGGMFISDSNDLRKPMQRWPSRLRRWPQLRPEQPASNRMVASMAARAP